ncbi:hypothetical protein CEE45_12370 [Candidatus Heimdallarchaeota archaeon B3_Heim]|nr:MAG: hypothetical protein CEE45_12370 [Candidatus Heimdallarchaeota archaeon B3_Heim]
MTEFDVPLLLLILKQICFGSLISGLLIFFLTLILQGSQLFDHDTDLDHDIDHDFDHGVGIDHDLGGVDLDVDVDIDSDLTVGIDKDIHLGMDKNLDLHDHGFDADTPAPLMLLLGTFMISFGGTGVIMIDNTINIIVLLAVLFLVPIGTTYFISKVWARIAVSEIYETPLQTMKVDDEVKTLTTVDTEGGLVLIHTSSIHGPVKMSAKTESGAIAKGMIAYVVKVKENSLLIDEWPSTEKTKKTTPEGSITWE